MKEQSNISARLASLDEIIKTTLPVFITPVPTRDTVRAWFDRAKIPKFKANPSAKRGGGPCFYSIPAVEKLMRSRTVGGIN